MKIKKVIIFLSILSLSKIFMEISAYNPEDFYSISATPDNLEIQLVGQDELGLQKKLDYLSTVCDNIVRYHWMYPLHKNALDSDGSRYFLEVFPKNIEIQYSGNPYVALGENNRDEVNNSDSAHVSEKRRAKAVLDLENVAKASGLHAPQSKPPQAIQPQESTKLNSPRPPSRRSSRSTAASAATTIAAQQRPSTALSRQSLSPRSNNSSLSRSDVQSWVNNTTLPTNPDTARTSAIIDDRFEISDDAETILPFTPDLNDDDAVIGSNFRPAQLKPMQPEELNDDSVALIPYEPENTFNLKSTDSDYSNALKILRFTAWPSSQKKLSARFKDLALQYHPDKNSSPDAEKQFKKISAAYNLLQEGFAKGFFKPTDSKPADPLLIEDNSKNEPVSPRGSGVTPSAPLTPLTLLTPMPPAIPRDLGDVARRRASIPAVEKKNIVENQKKARAGRSEQVFGDHLHSRMAGTLMPYEFNSTPKTLNEQYQESRGRGVSQFTDLESKMPKNIYVSHPENEIFKSKAILNRQDEANLQGSFEGLKKSKTESIGRSPVVANFSRLYDDKSKRASAVAAKNAWGNQDAKQEDFVSQAYTQPRFTAHTEIARPDRYYVKKQIERSDEGSPSSYKVRRSILGQADVSSKENKVINVSPASNSNQSQDLVTGSVEVEGNGAPSITQHLVVREPANQPQGPDGFETENKKRASQALAPKSKEDITNSRSTGTGISQADEDRLDALVKNSSSSSNNGEEKETSDLVGGKYLLNLARAVQQSGNALRTSESTSTNVLSANRSPVQQHPQGLNKPNIPKLDLSSLQRQGYENKVLGQGSPVFLPSPSKKASEGVGEDRLEKSATSNENPNKSDSPPTSGSLSRIPSDGVPLHSGLGWEDDSVQGGSPSSRSNLNASGSGTKKEFNFEALNQKVQENLEFYNSDLGTSGK